MAVSFICPFKNYLAAVADQAGLNAVKIKQVAYPDSSNWMTQPTSALNFDEATLTEDSLFVLDSSLSSSEEQHNNILICPDLVSFTREAIFSLKDEEHVASALSESVNAWQQGGERMLSMLMSYRADFELWVGPMQNIVALIKQQPLPAENYLSELINKQISGRLKEFTLPNLLNNKLLASANRGYEPNLEQSDGLAELFKAERSLIQLPVKEQQLNEEVNELKSQLENVIDASELELAHLQIAQLQEELEALFTENQKLTSDKQTLVTEKEQSVKQLTGQLEQARNNAPRVEAKNNKLNELEDKTAELELAQLHIAQLQEELEHYFLLSQNSVHLNKPVIAVVPNESTLTLLSRIAQ